MSEHRATLDDLKQAVAAIPDLFSPGVFASDFHMYKSIAWRTAFDWRDGWFSRMLEVLNRASGDISIIEEGAEGMRLIREKLR